MSKIYDRYYNKYKFHIEQFNSAAEVADVSSTRQMTSSSFDDIKKKQEETGMVLPMTKPLICSDMDISPQLTGTSILQLYQGGHDKWQQQELITNGSDAQGADISLGKWLADGMTGGLCPP